MRRQNCWEAMACGREPGGARAGELGPCPAALSGPNEGAHGGAFRGRMCWQVTGTLCDGKVSGSFARKMLKCLACRFLQLVQDQESRGFHLMPSLKHPSQ